MGECATCQQTIATCVIGAGCTPPSCGSATGGSGGGGGAGGSGGAGGTCSDLMKCCAAIANAEQKTQCNMAYTQVMAAGDQACGGILMIYRLNKLCP